MCGQLIWEQASWYLEEWWGSFVHGRAINEQTIQNSNYVTLTLHFVLSVLSALWLASDCTCWHCSHFCGGSAYNSSMILKPVDVALVCLLPAVSGASVRREELLIQTNLAHIALLKFCSSRETVKPHIVKNKRIHLGSWTHKGRASNTATLLSWKVLLCWGVQRGTQASRRLWGEMRFEQVPQCLSQQLKKSWKGQKHWKHQQKEEPQDFDFDQKACLPMDLPCPRMARKKTKQQYNMYIYICIVQPHKSIEHLARMQPDCLL